MLKAVDGRFLAMSDIYRQTCTTFTEMFGVWQKNCCQPGQDLFSHSTTASSACLPASLLTKSFLFVCHGGYHSMAISRVITWFFHQFSKKPQSGCMSTLYSRAEQCKTEGTRGLCGGSRYQHLVWFQHSVVLYSSDVNNSTLFLIFCRCSTCHRLGSCLFYKLHPGFIIQTVCSGSWSE